MLLQDVDPLLGNSKKRFDRWQRRLLYLVIHSRLPQRGLRELAGSGERPGGLCGEFCSKPSHGELLEKLALDVLLGLALHTASNRLLSCAWRPSLPIMTSDEYKNRPPLPDTSSNWLKFSPYITTLHFVLHSSSWRLAQLQEARVRKDTSSSSILVGHGTTTSVSSTCISGFSYCEQL